jgi:hypothetical protein
MDKESKIGKKLWSKPELTVLARNKSEEAVLETCKDEGGGHDGPAFSDRMCNAVGPGCPNCSEWRPS